MTSPHLCGYKAVVRVSVKWVLLYHIVWHRPNGAGARESALWSPPFSALPETHSDCLCLLSAFLHVAKSSCAVVVLLRTSSLQFSYYLWKWICVYHETLLQPFGFLMWFEPTRGLVLLFLSFVFLLCALFLFFWRPFSVSPPGFRPVGEIRMINHNGLGKISVCRMHRWGPHPASPLQEFQSLAWTVGSECTR